MDRVSRPPSTSRETVALPSATSTLDAKVAWGQSNNPANNCPVWLQSSSTAILSTFYIVFPKKLSRFFILKLYALMLEQRLMVVGQSHV